MSITVQGPHRWPKAFCKVYHLVVIRQLYLFKAKKGFRLNPLYEAFRQDRIYVVDKIPFSIWSHFDGSSLSLLPESDDKSVTCKSIFIELPKVVFLGTTFSCRVVIPFPNERIYHYLNASKIFQVQRRDDKDMHVFPICCLMTSNGIYKYITICIGVYIFFVRVTKCSWWTTIWIVNLRRL